MNSDAKASSHFDETGRVLLARLGSGGPGLYDHLNAIFEHPTGKGKIYVGNQTAASTLLLLQAHGITHVVNCTNGAGQIDNFHEGRMTYYRFPVSDWWRHINDSDGSVNAFVDPMLAFVDGAISHGDSVLVHCLAGAHRAGTTGCALLIHYRQLDHQTAIRTAKALRPIIDPICDFPKLLRRIEAVKLRK